MGRLAGCRVGALQGAPAEGLAGRVRRRDGIRTRQLGDRARQLGGRGYEGVGPGLKLGVLLDGGPLALRHVPLLHGAQGLYQLVLSAL